jgi:hypothetical protein
LHTCWQRFLPPDRTSGHDERRNIVSRATIKMHQLDMVKQPRVAAIYGLVMIVGCSAAPEDATPRLTPSDFVTNTGSGGQASVLPPAGGTSLVLQDGAGIVDDANGTCALHCSTDLHNVLDCNQNLVKACPADQGCGTDGSCVSPCESAKANGSVIGCEFFSVVPAPELQNNSDCFAALLANTWSLPISINVDYGGTPLDIAGIARTPAGSGASISYAPLVDGKLAPGQMAVVFLSNSNDSYNGGGYPIAPNTGAKHVNCPSGISPGVQANASIAKTGRGKAFHITTSAPVVAYDVYPFGGAESYLSSATLLVPTSAWGTNYIAADAYPAAPELAFAAGEGPLDAAPLAPFVQIVAAEDGTNVTLSPTAAIEGGDDVAGTPQGQPHTYAMNKGEVLQFLQNAELSGTPVASDRPISVWGGSACMNIPLGTGACDSGHQQLLPVKTLGNEYLGVRYRDRVTDRNESPPWTLVGAVDGTTLTYDPAPPPGAPLVLQGSQTVRFNAQDAFAVKSQDAQHPFYMAGHMTGSGVDSSASWGVGDPDYVNVVPPEQYLSTYLFLTDPTYKNTHLVFTRKKAEDGTFKPVSLGCIGEITGWTPVGTSGQYEYARVDLVVDGKPNGTCDNGVHTAKSDAPFGLTVWGWDTFVSYAYPAGLSVRPINQVVVPPVIR